MPVVLSYVADPGIADPFTRNPTLPPAPTGLTVAFSVTPSLYWPAAAETVVVVVVVVGVPVRISQAPRPCVAAPRIPKEVFKSISNTWALGNPEPKRLQVAPLFSVL